MQATIRDAKQVSQVLIESIKPLAIILYGSVARQGYGNDLDILVIISDTKPKIPIKKINSQIFQILSPFYKRIAIEPLVIFEKSVRDHYKKGSHFIRLILREGKLLFMNEATKEWIRQANEEIKMGDYLLNGKFFKGACYHYQQSIEKSIKAILLDKGWELEKVHSIKRLLTIADEYKIQIDIFHGNKNEENIIFIDSIYIGRYPGDAGLLPLGDPNKKDGGKAQRIAKENLNTVNKLIKL